jgi:putative PIN family toxin of toxin-antitoxin system
MRAVLDANVFISAVISDRGAPKRIIDYWREEAFELLTSEAILEEIEQVLKYPRIAALHKLSEAELNEFLALLREENRLVFSSEQLDVSRDGTDNRYIEYAVAGGADYLVTGDKMHLLPIGEYQGIRIVSPATFVTLLQVNPE